MNRKSADWDARYGSDLLKEHGPQYESYLAITSPSAWSHVEHFFPHTPRHLEFQQGMRAAYLDDLVPPLPDAEQVVAIGGGNALDVGKYVAWKLDKPLIMIPTIVSTGSVFQGLFAVRHPDTWDFHKQAISPEYLLFDTGVIRSAPPRLNCAGMGECICHMAIVGAWRWWTDQGLEGHPWDEAMAETTIHWVKERAGQFSNDMDANGQPHETGIRVAAEINRERYDLPTWNPKIAHSLDHVFTIAFEWVLRRELLHAESVALGTLINNYLCDWRFDETKALLDTCHVRYRPKDIGTTRVEVREVLNRINELNDILGNSQNWFHHRKLDDETFNSMIDKIEE